MNKTLALILGVAILFVFSACKGDKSGKAKGERPEIKGVTIVDVAPAVSDSFYETSGTVKAKSVGILASKTMGTVVNIRVKEGDKVKVNDVLMNLDDRDAAQRVKSAEAAYRESLKAREAAEKNKNLAEVTFKRYSRLYEEQVISQQEFDQMETQAKVAQLEYERIAGSVERAQAGLDEARIFLGFTRIAAPFAGVVTEKRIDTGSMASPGIPLLVIEDTSQYKIEAPVDERLLSRIKPGMPASITLDATGEKIQGRIAKIVSSVDPATRTFRIEIDVKGSSLKTGLYGKVTIPDGTREIISVPIKAVVEKGQLTGVYVVDNEGIVSYRLIKKGKVSDGKTEILSGLKTGDRIITEGIERAVDGGIVKQ
jgi:RND family efflux transporter MFP subunit